MQLPILLALSLGHLVVDLSQGGLTFLLPFFKEALGLSYTAVGALMMTSQLSSSVVQPIFGLWSDRHNLRWLLPLGCLVGGLGIALSGLTKSFPALLAVVGVGGLGVAAYHPEGSKATRWASGARRVTSMGIFAVGGNLGFSLGPLFAGLLYGLAGLKGTVGFLVPAAATALVLWVLLPRLRELEGGQLQAAKALPQDAQPEVLPFGYLPVVILLAVVFFRSWIHLGLTTYIPLYYVSHLGGDPLQARNFQTVFLLSGVAGTLIGSPLVERWDLKRALFASMAAQVPLILPLPQATGFWPYVLLAASGFTLISTFSVTVVLGQELLPRHLGLASGLMLGFSVGTGGLGLTILGAVADAWGVPQALNLLGLLPALAAGLVWLLPRPRLLHAA